MANRKLVVRSSNGIKVSGDETSFEDNIIKLNNATTGAPIRDGGIQVVRGDETDAFIIFDEINDEWTVGVSGELVRIATDTDIQSLSAAIDNIEISGGDNYDGEIQVLSGAIDTNTASISQLNTDLDDYATVAEVSAVSGNLNLKYYNLDVSTSYSIESLTDDITSNTFQISDRYTKAESDAKYLPNSGNNFYDGNLTVSGDLAISGSAFIVDTITVSASDNIIEINGGEVGNGVTAGYAGVRVNRGQSSDYFFVFDELRDAFVVGVASDETIGEIQNTQAVATRQDNPALNGVVFWNNSQKRMDTSFSFTYNSSTDVMNVGEIRTTGSVHLGNLSSPPGSATNGDMYYDTTTHKFRGYAGGIWVDLH